MFSDRRIKLSIIIFVLGVLTVGMMSHTAEAYIPTARDTQKAPDKVTYDITEFDRYVLLYETDTMRYYYREDRDIIAIEDKRSGYTWKSGIDVPYSSELSDAIKAATTDEELLAAAEPKEKSLNSTYIGIANSLITIEYSELESTKYISSASEKNAKSTLCMLNDNPATRRLDVEFDGIDIQLKVYVTFEEDSISYKVPFDEITGAGKNMITACILTPFLGASGGECQYFNPETGDYGDTVSKYMIPGYVMVPDGSGSLIRFQDNTSAFTSYIGDVYGKDPASETYYYEYIDNIVPIKDPVVPVFGIAHGDGQAAFIAYATSGAEYMDIIVNPEESKKVKYTWAYPRFEYNSVYYQVYNKKGSGYFTLSDEPDNFDVEMTYAFLSGDGSDGTPAADYTGMARIYREYLINEGILTPLEQTEGDIPIRIDFIMSDVKKSVIGTEQVVTTDVDGVAEILDDLIANGITNINSGLIGWQRKGETLAKPYSATFTLKVGSKSDFTKLIENYAEQGIDISFSRNFTLINKSMIGYLGNAAKHINTWYLSVDRNEVLPYNCPVIYYGYALPKKSAQWVKKLAAAVSDYSNSLTVTGISNTLLSTYSNEGTVTTLTEAAAMYQEALAEINSDMLLNLDNPNLYLWQYTDRYLQAPVSSSQYIFETDSVPFLQMVLNGTMEVYAPYANFSFYTDSDILRMIDYNVSPTFVFTKEPSYYLADTASADMYSTEYEQFKVLVKKVYGRINEVLSEVNGYEWCERRVIEEGVIVNVYMNGTDTRKVLINYTENAVQYEGITAESLTAVVIK